MLSLLNEETFAHVEQKKVDNESDDRQKAEQLLTAITYRISEHYMTIYRDARTKLDVFLSYLKNFLRNNRFGINFFDTIVVSSENDFYFDRSVTELPHFVVLIPFRRPPNSKLVKLYPHLEEGYCAIQIGQDSPKDELSKLKMPGQAGDSKRYLSKSGSVKILRDVLQPNWPLVIRTCTRVIRGFQGELRYSEINLPGKLIGVFTIQMLARQAIEEGFISADSVAQPDRQLFQYEFTVEFGVAMSIEHETGFKEAYLTTMPYFSNDAHAFTETLWHYSYKPIESRITQTVCQADRMKRLDAVTCILYMTDNHPLFRDILNHEHVRSALLYSVDQEVDHRNFREVLQHHTFSVSWQRQSLTECFINLLRALLPFVRRGVFPHFFIEQLDLFRFSSFRKLPESATKHGLFPPITNIRQMNDREQRLYMLQMLIANWIRSPAALARDLAELTKVVQIKQEKAEKELGRLVGQIDRKTSFITLISEGDFLFKPLALRKPSKSTLQSSRSYGGRTSRHSRRSSMQSGSRASTSTARRLSPTLE